MASACFGAQEIQHGGPHNDGFLKGFYLFKYVYFGYQCQIWLVVVVVVVAILAENSFVFVFQKKSWQTSVIACYFFLRLS